MTRIRRFVPLLLVVLLPACAGTRPAGSTAEEGFTSLFDGRSLDGWRRHETVPESDVGGKWEVVDGALTGDQDPPGRGGFLITSGTYDDYVLRLEAKLDYPVDSGIFLRMGDDGKSHQVTLDFRPGGDIGAIYLPWTQGSVEKNPEGVQAFDADGWNDLEVRVEGEPPLVLDWE